MTASANSLFTIARRASHALQSKPQYAIYSFISAEKNALDEDMTKTAKLAFSVLLMFMVMYTTYRMDARLGYFEKSSEARAVWDKGYAYCEACAKKGEILYRAPMGINALAAGRYLYDNGHEMAIHQRFLDEYNLSTVRCCFQKRGKYHASVGRFVLVFPSLYRQ